jgi:aspartate/methionine/tyrosine aminotransferase
MPFVPFELEAWQSAYEQEVEFNLADSGVHPVRVGELVTEPAAVRNLLDTALHYPPVNGTPLLRSLIARLYDHAHLGNVLVTVGAAEATAISMQTLLSPGDRVVVLEPGYRQAWGLAQNLGCEVRSFWLRRELGWRPDLEELEAALRPEASGSAGPWSPASGARSVRLIAVSNPNNPTGAILTEGEMELIAAAAADSGAWLLADEVYRGTERLTDAETPSFWGRYERTIAVGSLSKAYGLPGLRTGWLLAPAPLVERIWRRHEYATISTGMLSNSLAEIALDEPMRTRLIERTRSYIRAGYELIERWLGALPDLVSIVPPQATALALVRYHFDLPSVEVADAIRTRAGVLVAPGSCFGVEGHLRIALGLEPAVLNEALRRVARVLRQLQDGRSHGRADGRSDGRPS